VNSLIRSASSAERHGHSTREILASVNYSAAEIDAMIDAGVASLGWTDEHLPSDTGDQRIAISRVSIAPQQTPELLNDWDIDPDPELII